MSGRLLPLPLLLALLAGGAPLAAQVVEEDLTIGELESAPVLLPGQAETAELEAELDAALELFASADQGAALPAFSHIVDVLGQRAAGRALTLPELDLLARTLGYRARARFNLGDAEGARADLAALLEAKPEAELDATQVSPRLLEMFSDARQRTVGDLGLETEPPDARVEIDGRPVERIGSAPFGVRAGSHVLLVSRAGYAPRQIEVDVPAGGSVRHEIELDRTGPVIRLLTRPRGAEVRIDGELRGITDGTAPEGFLPQGAAALYRRDEFSSELIVEELQPGIRRLEVRREGFRPYRAELQIGEPIDYVIPPIVLEEEQSTVILRGLPPDAELRVDGRPARPDNPGAPVPQIALPPGPHRISVQQGNARMFVRDVQLADRQTVEIDVRLRPGLAFLGVLGGDRTAGGRLRESLVAHLDDSAKWTVLERSEAVDTGAAGLTAAAWRRHGAFGPGIDWKAVQSAVDAAVPGLVYVIGVLSDDLVAERADLVVWPSAPGPATPSAISVRIGSTEDMQRVRALFEATLRLRGPEAGMLVIDTDAAPHPVVAHVSPGGAAEAAGIRAGERIVAVGGQPLIGAARYHEVLATASPGEAIEMGVQGPGGTRAVRVTLGSTPWVSSRRDETLLDPVAYSELVLLEEKVSPEDRWIVRVNQGLISLRARDWETAVLRFREAEAPENPRGLGSAAVDYWMGIALSRLGGGYLDQAMRLLERAAGSPDARLYHDHGPWVAPLARTRLENLRAGG